MRTTHWTVAPEFTWKSISLVRLGLNGFCHLPLKVIALAKMNLVSLVNWASSTMELILFLVVLLALKLTNHEHTSSQWDSQN